MNEVLEYLRTYRDGRRRAVEGGSVGFYFAKTPTPATSLTGLPRDAEFVVIDGRVRELDDLLQVRSLKALWITYVGDREVGVIRQLRSLRALVIGELRLPDLQSLAVLTDLQHLVCQLANRLRTIGLSSSLPQLATLHLGELRHLSDLTEIGAFTSLTQLVLHGGMWSKLRVKSLRPIGALTRLEDLFLASLHVADDTLSHLASLQGLQYLGLPNVFPLAECAALAAALPRTRGKILTPFFAGLLDGSEPSPSGACKTCGAHRVMTTGKPVRQLCPRCDRARIDQHFARWNAALTGAVRQRSNTHPPSRGA